MSNPDDSVAKPIVARDQVKLGLARCWQLAVTGMSYRLFRSLVTTAILALAAAFLVHMLGFGLLESETQSVAYAQTQSTRRLGQDILRLTKPDSDRAILTALGTADLVRENEYVTWAKLDAPELEFARSTARELAAAAEYFGDLATAPKAVLVGDRSMDELFDQLAIPLQFATFEQRLHRLALRPPLSDLQAFGRLLRESRPRFREIVGRIRTGQQAAIEHVAADLGPANQALVEQPPERVQAAIQRAGYALHLDRLSQMREFAVHQRQQRAIEQLLILPQVLGAVARRVSVEPKDVNFERLTDWIQSSSDVRWFHALLLDAGAVALPEPESVGRLLAQHRRERHLSLLGGKQAGSHSGVRWGLSPRNQWLIVLSFIVCMVGVANAMLMSVTERFTEIATMKCLGAIDRFVMTMFVLEALIQGAVGGAVGLLLGIVLALLRGVVEFGALLTLASGATSRVLLAMLLSLVATMILAALSAIGPAYVAARLSPMEAMRVE